MEIKSYIQDHKVRAVNVLIELPIGEYLQIAESILGENDFQRKRVIKSTVSRQLKADLLIGCTIPPIILAISENATEIPSDYKKIENLIADRIVKLAFHEKKLLIIDGLQRTNVLIELENDLIREEKTIELALFRKQKIRAEIYVGIDKLGILYRMITLNTGQQTMSLRHLTEILYQDYTKINWEKNINLVTQKDSTKIKHTTTDFSFKDILDGFNSYLIRDEQLLTKVDVLTNIKNIKKVAEIRRNEKDAFKDFVLTYQRFLQKIDTISNGWQFDENNIGFQEYKLNNNPFGKDAITIFKKSQPLSGFGATVGLLSKLGYTFEDVNNVIDGIEEGEESIEEGFQNLVKQLDLIREDSKRIGVTQRTFFKYFFKSLLSPGEDETGQFDKAIDRANQKTRIELEWA